MVYNPDNDGRGMDKTMKAKAMLNKDQILTILVLFPLDALSSLTCEKLAELLHISPAHLSRSIRLAGKDSLEKSMQTIRVFRAAIAFSDTPGLSVKDAAAKVGYEDAKHFSRIFKQILGIYPKEYKCFLEACRNAVNPQC